MIINLYVRGIVSEKGYGVSVLEYRGKTKIMFIEQEQETSSNRMTLRAIIKGLEAIKKPCEVNVYMSGLLGLNNKKYKGVNKELIKEVYDIAKEKDIEAKYIVSSAGQGQLIKLLKEYKKVVRQKEKDIYYNAFQVGNLET